MDEKVYHPRSERRAYWLLALFLGSICLLFEAIFWAIFFWRHRVDIPTILIIQIIVVLFFCVPFALFILIGRHYSKYSLTLSSEGMVYDIVHFRIYTPWQNIAEIQGTSFPGVIQCLLHEPLTDELTIEEGKQQGVAVIEFRRKPLPFVRGHSSQKKFTVDTGQIGIGDWVDGDLGDYLRRYAPHVKYAQKERSLSEQVRAEAERLQLGEPLNEHYITFKRIYIAMMIFYIAADIFFIYMTYPAFTNLRYIFQDGAAALRFALASAFWLYIFRQEIPGVLVFVRALREHFRRSMVVAVCLRGLLYIKDGAAEAFPWSQISYRTARRFLVNRVIVSRADGKSFPLLREFCDDGLLFWKLVLHTREQWSAPSDIPLPLPKIYRPVPSDLSLLWFFLVFLGIVEAILVVVFISISPFQTQNFALSQVIIASILLFVVGLAWLRRRISRSVCLLLSEDGLTYDGYGFRIYTPWQNIAGLQFAPGQSVARGLVLHTPALVDISIEEGKERGIAVIERPRWLWRLHSKKRFVYRTFFPIEASLVGSSWWQGEFAGYLRRYAPQAFKRDDQ